MTSTQATYAAILSMEGPPPSRIERIRARIAASPAIRNFASARSSHPANPGLHLVASASESAHPRFHPGDIAYWVACLGGASLLLLCATR